MPESCATLSGTELKQFVRFVRCLYVTLILRVYASSWYYLL
uniref:Uncharacterized protein n=1 Tax=Myoviridae sp. ctQ6D10 TaxID=2827288 RepID=A0A8S5R5X3_9CAUD|nr:MAG TPA: hypothetical protein [Myoviridae sp. ctQ6D10]